MLAPLLTGAPPKLPATGLPLGDLPPAAVEASRLLRLLLLLVWDTLAAASNEKVRNVCDKGVFGASPRSRFSCWGCTHPSAAHMLAYAGSNDSHAQLIVHACGRIADVHVQQQSKLYLQLVPVLSLSLLKNDLILEDTLQDKTAYRSNKPAVGVVVTQQSVAQDAL